MTVEQDVLLHQKLEASMCLEADSMEVPACKAANELRLVLKYLCHGFAHLILLYLLSIFHGIQIILSALHAHLSRALRMQADFANAAEAAVYLANARQRLLAALKRAEAGCRAQAEEPPAAVQAVAHVVNGVSA